MHNFVNPKKSWFFNKYYRDLGMDPFDYGRFSTFQIALNLYLQREGLVIVETGCQRELDDWGAGCSTQLFYEFTQQYGGQLYSIDINKENIQLAKTIAPTAQFLYGDSIKQLEILGSCICADLLYLDSLDYPYGPILEKYGGKENLNESLEILKTVPDDEILEEFESLVLPCQEHCRSELITAFEFDLLQDHTVVLIDDANLAGGGKARLAKEWLVQKGWHCVLDAYQTLWIKGT